MFGCIYLLCIILYITAVLHDRCWFCCSILTVTIIKEHYYDVVVPHFLFASSTLNIENARNRKRTVVVIEQCRFVHSLTFMCYLFLVYISVLFIMLVYAKFVIIW